MFCPCNELQARRQQLSSIRYGSKNASKPALQEAMELSFLSALARGEEGGLQVQDRTEYAAYSTVWLQLA